MHCACQVRVYAQRFCLCFVLDVCSEVVSLSSSEAGDMGGFIGQLCRINSNYSRGTVNTLEKTTGKK